MKPTSSIYGDFMVKLQVRANQPSFGSPVKIVDCPCHQIELSIAHCNDVCCRAYYKGRVEKVEEKVHLLYADMN
jgi:hypothetical protein